ncbi:MAG: serine/threonine-protein kinase [Planctomycetota bacterium]
MSGPEDKNASLRDPDDGDRPSRADLSMAELLAEDHVTPRAIRDRVASRVLDSADELLARANALEFIDQVVGDFASGLPEQLGSYRIVGVLGRGGMGTVYEAIDETLDRLIALKVLAPGLGADPRMRKRFRTEARASANLHHENIVPIYGYGESDGNLYFAMERVDGISLDKHIAAARRMSKAALEPVDAARRFAGIANALAHAHKRGVLHRDVKPGNILVHPDGSFALADFGLSKLAGEQSLSLSQAGGFLGTLQYAAPEQARARPVSEASDLYSLGVTIFETVTGRLPFEAKTTEAILHALIHEEPRPLRKVLPKAPRDFELVLERLMAKEPEDRYRDGEQLARDLLRISEDEPITLRRRSTISRAWRWARKHRAIVGTSIVTLLLLAVIGFQWWRNRENEAAARISRHDVLVSRAIGEAEREAGSVCGPSDLAAVLIGSVVPSSDAQQAIATLDEAESENPKSEVVAQLRSALRDDPLPSATAALREGRGYAALRLLDPLIEEMENGNSFSSRETAVGLQLYRLYFARAIAAMTASVGDLDAAARDLLRATMLRRGAIAPAVLREFVDWEPTRGVSVLAQRLEALLARYDRPAAAELAVALLRAAAAPARPRDAHLWVEGLDAPTRRELLALAQRLHVDKSVANLVGESVSTDRLTDRAGGLDATFAEAARQAASELSDETSRSRALATMAAALESEIDPRSPLQSWRVVLELLSEPDVGRFAARITNLALPLPVVARGLADLAELDLPVDLFGRLMGYATNALAPMHPSATTHAIFARFAERAGQAEAATTFANEWVRLDSANADAYLCLLRCRLASERDLDWVPIDGARVVQLALDRSQALRAVRGVIEAAARASSDLQRRTVLDSLAQRFAPAGP